MSGTDAGVVVAPDLEQAREFLRDQLAGLAVTAAPDSPPVLLDAVGPIRLAGLFAANPAALVCSVTVQTRSPAPLRHAAVLGALASALTAEGWLVRSEFGYGHHRLCAERDGFRIAGHAFDGHDELTFAGQTPRQIIES